jgi:hypothetical protein
MLYSHNDAIKIKKENENLVGSILYPEITPLLRLIIIQKTPTEFGGLWANQREAFEDEDNSKVISDEEFENQMKEFENIDLSKKDGYFYYVIGVFRSTNGEPRFQPLEMLLLNNS